MLLAKREKRNLSDHEKENISSPKNRIFFKGVNPCFWPKFDQNKPRNNAF